MKPILRALALLLCAGNLGHAQTAPGAPGGTANAPQPLAPSNIPSNAMPPSPTAPNTTPGNPLPPNPNATDLWSQNYLTGNWGGFRDELKKRGIQFTPNLTSEVFGNPSGGRKQGAITDGVMELPLDIDFDPLTGGAVKDLIFHVNAFYIYGNSLSAEDVGDFSITSNLAAYNTLRLQELWAQKLFGDKKLSVKVGNIAIDTEFFLSNSSSLFMSGTFGSFTFIANNVPNVPVYPLASPGVRLQFLPTPQTYVMAGVFGQDANSNASTTNQNGIRFALTPSSGALVMSEAGYLLNQGPDDKGLQGTYKIGSWLDTGDHTTFASQAAFANGTGPLQNAGANYGVYGVLDQQIYSEEKRIISLFVRSGSTPSNTNFVDWYVDGGFNFTGFIPGRDSDVAGIAVARSHVSGQFSEAQVAQGNPPSTAETVIEATYKIQFAPWWQLQPDVQYIITPSGVVGSHDATVLGLRTVINF